MLHAMLPLNWAKISMLDLWKPISTINLKKVIVTFYLTIQTFFMLTFFLTIQGGETKTFRAIQLLYTTFDINSRLQEKCQNCEGKKDRNTEL